MSAVRISKIVKHYSLLSYVPGVCSPYSKTSYQWLQLLYSKWKPLWLRQSSVASLSTFSSGNVSKNWAVCMHAVPACVSARVRLYMWKEATKQQCPYSQCDRKCESPTLMLCSAHCLPEGNTPFPPWVERWQWPDLGCPVYLPGLCLWICCSHCHSDNMWIKLSLTHPLREGISGSSSPCNAPPRLLINDKANPLALHMASWLRDAPFGVRKGTNGEEGLGQRRRKTK